MCTNNPTLSASKKRVLFFFKYVKDQIINPPNRLHKGSLTSR